MTLKRIRIKWSPDREVLAAMLLVVVLIGTLGVTVYRQIVVVARTLYMLDSTRQVAVAGEDLYRHLLNAETSQRGYIITGDPAYLDPYRQGVENVRDQLAALLLLAEEPGHDTDNLTAFAAQVEQKLADLETTLEVRSEHGFEAARALIASDRGKVLMDDIRAWLRDLIAYERQQFTDTHDLLASRAQRVGLFVTLLTISVLALAITIYLLVRRNADNHLTVERQLSAALRRERELNEMKSHFIRTVSHEFRTPLAIVQTSADLLQRYSDRMTEPQREGHLVKLQQQVARLTALLEDALTVHKAQFDNLPYKPELTDLSDLCRATVDAVRANAPSRQIDLHVSGGDFRLPVDSRLLTQALTNLLTNALLFSEASQPVAVRLERNTDSAVISVQDHGTGIAHDDQSQVFDLFFRGSNAADVPGAGLGLPVARAIVDLHAGKLTLDSCPGSGSTFTIHLPAAPMPEAEPVWQHNSKGSAATRA